MDNKKRKEHWEKIYKNKNADELSWYQSTPVDSLYFLKKFDLPKNAKIIDIGGGDSYFVDYLLELGFTNITVLDISQRAIERAKKRLGSNRNKVKWVVSDVTEFKSSEKFDLWHDRAAFHFLTDKKDIETYINTVKLNVKQGAYLVIGTFSENGPSKCSGIDIKRYSEQTMNELLKAFFKKIKCITVDHKTPFNTIQNFIFCSFKRLSSI